METQDLIGYLSDRYTEELSKEFPTATAADFVQRAKDFVEFAQDFLRKNPPQQVNYPQGGLGVTLSNQDMVLIAPADNVASSPGGMQPSVSIPVSGASTMQDMARNQTNRGNEVISGVEDRSQGSGPINYKLPQARR